MTQLSLAGSELTEGFRDRHTFNPALQKLVELVAARRNTFDIFALLKDDHPRPETLGLDLLCDFVKLIAFGLSDTFDIQHFFLGTIQGKL